MFGGGIGACVLIVCGGEDGDVGRGAPLLAIPGSLASV